jgi:hypothetical protein
MPLELARPGSAELAGSLGASGPNYCGSALSKWGHQLSDHRMLNTRVHHENHWLAPHFHFIRGLSGA